MVRAQLQEALRKAMEDAALQHKQDMETIRVRISHPWFVAVFRTKARCATGRGKKRRRQI